ncbi:hypothetical protein [Flavimaricola marinus]|uniref:Uncharacterized protein n=1 Tax=Flavimaricola marinus TaxID=1819565 RepID=A0A238LIC3_9RHOB|nr:hypothetical protein [Flavimaricola marinus]SMY09378.1 hypothetical protein LOM8899_03544 [Flavimaricola marinus]
MQRHIVDRPRAPSTSRRLAQFLRLDLQKSQRMLQSDRTRGQSRLRHYLRIARGYSA